jgi:hypothetical protein
LIHQFASRYIIITLDAAFLYFIFFPHQTWPAIMITYFSAEIWTSASINLGKKSSTSSRKLGEKFHRSTFGRNYQSS